MNQSVTQSISREKTINEPKISLSRFRTFLDFMDGACVTAFSQRRRFLEEKLTLIPLFLVMLLLSNHLAPVDAAKTQQFHDESGFLYTFW